MKYLGLDAVWWLVSPGNPLKSKVGLPNLEIRARWCQELIQNPRIVVSTIESDLGTIRTFDTVLALQTHFPETDFVWLSGTDIVYEFRKWHKWRELAKTIPFAFIGRPTKYGVVRKNAFTQIASLTHKNLNTGGCPPLKKGLIYWIFGESLNPMSSTLLRSKAKDICDSYPKGVK